jgi:hypothetical protein
VNIPIRHDHEVLLESLLKGKLPRNLRWSEVVELIGQVGKVEQHGGDEFAFQVGTQRAFFKRPHGHDFEVEETSRLRLFLREAGLSAPSNGTPSRGRTIVIIDHHGAHIYEHLSGGKLEKELAVAPYDPFGFHRRLIHRKEAHYQGERVPEETSFYEEVAADLTHAEEIILVGHATGKSSALTFFAEYLKTHHPAISERVVLTEKLDLSALTEPQIEQIVKKHLGTAESTTAGK